MMEQYKERFDIAGIVQGVGFRPFVYGLARRFHLKGRVYNTPDGVVVETVGIPSDIEGFADALIAETPPLAHIVAVTRQSTVCIDDYTDSPGDFIIDVSGHEGRPLTLIPPDTAVCDDCLDELFDPTDRRHLYPFINCTNCGPRFTIIRSLPYDRPATTMASFVMCEACGQEYADPEDRRFHAQPNACPVCGPQVSLLDSSGGRIGGEPVQETIRLLRDGAIVAVKGLGGFHLAVDATNDDAVCRLRSRKRREEKPLAVMVGSLAAAECVVRLTDREKRLISGIERPVVLVRALSVTPVAPSVAPGNAHLGVMLPYTPLHYLLFFHPGAGGCFPGRPIFDALVMTSGNISDEPIASDNDNALSRLTGIADAFLVHDRDIHVRCDDSVVTTFCGEPLFIRRARGFVPKPVFLPDETPCVFAAGPELKNTFCITEGRRAFLSQHIGDLENVETLDLYREAVDHLKSVLDLTPEIYVHDLHPDYLSTRYVREIEDTDDSVGIVGVQHHHAHIVSVLAEHACEGSVIGIALDGTGLGTDGTIWGGEIVVATPETFARAAHIVTVPMPGGERAIREPWRMAASWLEAAFGADWLSLEIECLNQTDRADYEMLGRGIAAGRFPLTSSLGRLFDAVASMTGICHKSSFEGQAAYLLDIAAQASPTVEPYPYTITTAPVHPETSYPRLGGSLKNAHTPPPPILGSLRRIDVTPTIQAIAGDMNRAVPPERIARAFHETVLHFLFAAVSAIREETGIETVALSGGSWQNRILGERLPVMLESDGFSVLTNRLVPVTDGGISLGQAWIGARMARFAAESR